MSDLERTSRKVKTGIVVSDKRENTVTVAIELQYPHPKYGKIVKKTTNPKIFKQQTKVTGNPVFSKK